MDQPLLPRIEQAIRAMVRSGAAITSVVVSPDLAERIAAEARAVSGEEHAGEQIDSFTSEGIDYPILVHPGLAPNTLLLSTITREDLARELAQPPPERRPGVNGHGHPDPDFDGPLPGNGEM